MAFSGDFEPVLAKHSKNFSLQNALSIGVDLMQRNFEGMRAQVEAWRQSQLSDVDAKLIIYRAFVESDLEVPKHLARPVHELYFNPQHEEFQPRTLWSLSNAFTSAFKELDPIPQFRATAKLAASCQSPGFHSGRSLSGGTKPSRRMLWYRWSATQSGVMAMLYAPAVVATVLAEPPHGSRPAVIRWIVLLHSLLLPNLGQSQSPPPVGRPILFVHGFCDQAAS